MLFLATLILVAAALGVHFLLDVAPPWTFVAGVVAIVPLAEWIRRGTEHVARRAGSAVGGLLNSTFGNTAELVLAIFVLLAGNAEVVKAQITGSIIGNGLLGFGLAITVGTWGRRELRFKPQRAALLSSLLMLAVIALLVPALFDYTERGIFASTEATALDEKLSLAVAVVLIVVYAANLAYTLVTHRDVFALEESPESEEATWPLWRALAVLVTATAATAGMADLVSGALEKTATGIGVSTFFLGVVVLAVVGNAAEYFSSVYFARQGRIGLVASITVGSTIQVALLVAPVLVLLSHLLGQPMDLVFDNPLELVAIASVAFVVNAITRDGEVTWFEGVLLVAVYVLLAFAFFFATPPPG
ncbi:MAG: calcium/proton exchanger [Sphingomonadaceae bacterium]